MDQQTIIIIVSILVPVMGAFFFLLKQNGDIRKDVADLRIDMTEVKTILRLRCFSF